MFNAYGPLTVLYTKLDNAVSMFLGPDKEESKKPRVVVVGKATPDSPCDRVVFMVVCFYHCRSCVFRLSGGGISICQQHRL